MLLTLIVLLVAAGQEWAATLRVYQWLIQTQAPELAVLEIFLSFALAAALGVKLFKRVGIRLLQRAQQQLALGQAPDQTLAAGVLLLASAFLLILPGYLSDALGLGLLLARGPLSRLLVKLARRRLAAGKIHVHTFGGRDFSWRQAQHGAWQDSPRERRKSLEHDPLVIDVAPSEDKT